MKKITTLFCTLMITGAAFAQIPNPSFESWTSHTGYDTPDSWGNTNPFTVLSSTYTCDKGTSGAPAGSNYIKLTTKNCGVVVPGVAVTGTIGLSGTSVSVSGGFPNTSRPATLNGQWQYMAASGTDHAHVIVFLSKWNTATSKRDTVAFTDSSLNGMAMSWAPFSITLNYYSGKTPDSALIILSSSNLSATTAVVNSYLYVDTLAFAGSVPSGVTTINNAVTSTVIFPNPAANGHTTLYYNGDGSSVKVSITDMNGRIVKTMTEATTKGTNYIQINTSEFAPGMYFIRITNEQGSEVKKLIVE